jgi:hypothetical protein
MSNQWYSWCDDVSELTYISSFIFQQSLQECCALVLESSRIYLSCYFMGLSDTNFHGDGNRKIIDSTTIDVTDEQNLRNT